MINSKLWPKTYSALYNTTKPWASLNRIEQEEILFYLMEEDRSFHQHIGDLSELGAKMATAFTFQHGDGFYDFKKSVVDHLLTVHEELLIQLSNDAREACYYDAGSYADDYDGNDPVFA